MIVFLHNFRNVESELGFSYDIMILGSDTDFTNDCLIVESEFAFLCDEILADIFLFDIFLFRDDLVVLCDLYL